MDWKDWQLIEQNSYIFVIHLASLIYIMINHDISWHFVIKTKNIIFCCENAQLQHFCRKIYDYALIDDFWGSAGFLDSPTSYVNLLIAGIKYPNYIWTATFRIALLPSSLSNFWGARFWAAYSNFLIGSVDESMP